MVQAAAKIQQYYEGKKLKYPTRRYAGLPLPPE